MASWVLLEHKIASQLQLYISLISFVSISAFRKLTENIKACVRKLVGLCSKRGIKLKYNFVETPRKFITDRKAFDP